ncbi:MAG: hypothetical protein JST26_17655 [Bacteroidetes bacterium]|nr:hypothetical protein [Bacteroidota bacterium]
MKKELMSYIVRFFIYISSVFGAQSLCCQVIAFNSDLIVVKDGDTLKRYTNIEVSIGLKDGQRLISNNSHKIQFQGDLDSIRSVNVSYNGHLLDYFEPYNSKDTLSPLNRIMKQNYKCFSETKGRWIFYIDNYPFECHTLKEIETKKNCTYFLLKIEECVEGINFIER